jgi:hypothetical protein
MIDYLVHAYANNTEPFQSLSALPEQEALQIMEALYVEGEIFWERFKKPKEFLTWTSQNQKGFDIFGPG